MRTEDGLTSLRTAKGTQKFVAPEVLLSDDKSPYTNAVDIWSAGMIAFLVLVGMPNMNFISMLRFSVGLEKSFPDQTLISQEISLNGRSFVRALLQCDAKDRPSATKSLQHNWFRGMNDFVQNLRTMVIQDNRSSDIGANVTISQSHPPVADRPAVLTTQSTSSLVPTAQWSTNQSRQGEGFGFSPEHTAVPLLAQTLTTSKSDSALSESDLLQHRGDTDDKSRDGDSQITPPLSLGPRGFDFIEVHIQVLGHGMLLPLKVFKQQQIKDVKKKIEEREKIPADEHFLALGIDPLLDDNATIDGCGIKDQDVLYWIPSP